MADEPNKRMDEVLKAYAEKRRQEAGAAMELHPATRQMLQAEVARTYKQAPQASWLQRLLIFWPRMAFAAACLAITFTLVLIVLPRQTVTEMAQTKELESLALDQRAVDKEKADNDGFSDAPALTAAASTAPVTPPPSVDRLAKLSEADELKAKSELAAEAPRKDGAANEVRLMREEQAKKPAELRQLYVNSPEPVRARYKQQEQEVRLGTRLQTVQPILNNFQIEQTGDKIQVVDQDGSVYSGNVFSNDDAMKRYYNFRKDAPAAQAPASQTGIAGQAQIAAPTGEVQSLFFAFGTNISLKQEVSIEGNILLVTNAVMPALAPANAGRVNQRGAAQNIITGRARVGTNQEVFINAVPTQP